MPAELAETRPSELFLRPTEEEEARAERLLPTTPAAEVVAREELAQQAREPLRLRAEILALQRHSGRLVVQAHAETFQTLFRQPNGAARAVQAMTVRDSLALDLAQFTVEAAVEAAGMSPRAIRRLTDRPAEQADHTISLAEVAARAELVEAREPQAHQRQLRQAVAEVAARVQLQPLEALAVPVGRPEEAAVEAAVEHLSAAQAARAAQDGA